MFILGYFFFFLWFFYYGRYKLVLEDEDFDFVKYIKEYKKNRYVLYLVLFDYILEFWVIVNNS